MVLFSIGDVVVRVGALAGWCSCGLGVRFVDSLRLFLL